MANRIRNERLEIKLTEEEKALFEEKIPYTLDNCLNLYKSLFYGTSQFTTIC